MTRAEAAVRRRARRRSRLWVPALLAAVLAAAWLWPDAPQQPPAGHIPQQLLDLAERNPEARTFVYDYPEQHDACHAIDLTAEASSETVPLLLQWDERWGYGRYAGDFFALTGCGPTCLSMAALYLTGDDRWSPAAVGQYAAGGGYAVDGSGTAWALFSEGVAPLGLSSRELPLDGGTVLDALDGGELVACVVGPGDFTTTGHFLLLTGWTDGGVALNDPNSRGNTEALWPWETLSGQIRGLWALGARTTEGD